MIVHHDERDVEFHDLMDQVQRLLPGDGQYGPASCETIARRIHGELASKYPERQLSVTVLEDGEAGATVDAAYEKAQAQEWRHVLDATSDRRAAGIDSDPTEVMEAS